MKTHFWLEMTQRVFSDREEAGRQLAALLSRYQGRPNVVVLGLPRGGVPVAAEVARALKAPLDLLTVRKIGVPGHRELAMGAVATGGVVVADEELMASIGLSRERFDEVLEVERKELARRERVYRGDRPLQPLDGKIVIIVDDGLATGSTMRAAVGAVRRLRPASIVVAVPTAPPSTVGLLLMEADEVVCPQTPEPFYAVGMWYEDFHQVSDEEVRTLLEQAPKPASFFEAHPQP